MTRWLSFVGAPGTSVRCNCALAERQRIFDLERRVADAEGALLLEKSSIGAAKYQTEIMRLEGQRDRAWALLKELGVSVMP